MNVLDTLLVTKQDVNLKLLTDFNCWWYYNKSQSFRVTPKLSVFRFIFQLLKALKECLLSFLTVNWTFNIVEYFCRPGGGTIIPTWYRSPALNNHSKQPLWVCYEVPGMCFFALASLGLSFVLIGLGLHLCFLAKWLMFSIAWYGTLLIAMGITQYTVFL